MGGIRVDTLGGVSKATVLVEGNSGTIFITNANIPYLGCGWVGCVSCNEYFNHNGMCLLELFFTS